ncbi:lipopolysaccharide heptosyltransferase II [Candidatus Marinimicrobia bacterium MT.SAG.2]|nr:lipopolysaccharide heptosyltransferase II [Candidatus Marinimicrobia bacterium MT.SAG.2]
MKHLLEYWVLLLASFTAKSLTESGAKRFSRIVAWLAYRALRYRRRVALRNLRDSFPDKSSEEIQSILRNSYINFGIVTVEFLRLGSKAGKKASSELIINGSEHIDRVLKNKSGSVLAAGHIGNWELLGSAMAQRWPPVKGIAVHMSNPYSDKFIEKLRFDGFEEVIYKSEPATSFLRSLKEGCNLGVISDQDAGKSGVFIDFLGRKASTPKGAAFFALKAKVPLFTVYSKRLDDGNYQAEIIPVELDYDGKITEEKIKTATQEIAYRLENFIRENPDQWLWFHKRWKTRPPDEQEKKRVLILQTAFLGDVVLATPMAESIKNLHPEWEVDFLTTPESAALLENNPNISRILTYDKNKSERGVKGFLSKISEIEAGAYDIALIPHRSIRSAALVRFAGIPQRVGFDKSAGYFLFTERVKYENELHEVERNLKLVESLNLSVSKVKPRLYPSSNDLKKSEKILKSSAKLKNRPIIAIAPGSIWPTKRWPIDNYIELAGMLVKDGFGVVVLGGEKDKALFKKISMEGVEVFAGTTTLLESAALLKKCEALVTNDSAPLHFAVAVDTPVVAIFGATAPKFGFYPYNSDDIVIERELPCRPCAIHGGMKCPIGTFECMLDIGAEEVFNNVKKRILLKS